MTASRISSSDKLHRRPAKRQRSLFEFFKKDIQTAQAVSTAASTIDSPRNNLQDRIKAHFCIAPGPKTVESRKSVTGIESSDDEDEIDETLVFRFDQESAIPAIQIYAEQLQKDDQGNVFVLPFHDPQAWERIQNLLLHYSDGVQESAELVSMLTKCRSVNQMNARWLCRYIDDYLPEQGPERRSRLFQTTLPLMIQHCLNAPKCFADHHTFPTLSADRNMELAFTPLQVYTILALSFFGFIPGVKRSKYPGLHFDSLFRSYKQHESYLNSSSLHSSRSREPSDTLFQQQCAKLDCIFAYFSVDPDTVKCERTIRFKRLSRNSSHIPDWIHHHESVLRLVTVSLNGNIEDTADKCLQVDFANAYIGGGVLSKGCVQEEIKFLMNPECIISRLFTERLNVNESVFIYGTRRFSRCEGYARDFRWKSQVSLDEQLSFIYAFFIFHHITHLFSTQYHRWHGLHRRHSLWWTWQTRTVWAKSDWPRVAEILCWISADSWTSWFLWKRWTTHCYRKLG